MSKIPDLDIEDVDIDQKKFLTDDNLLNFLITGIERFWKLIVLSTLCGGVLVPSIFTALGGYNKTQVYEATAELRVKRISLAARWGENYPEILSPIIPFEELLRKLEIAELVKTIEQSL